MVVMFGERFQCLSNQDALEGESRFSAFDTQLQTDVDLRVLRPGVSSSKRKRFVEEASALASLPLPGIQRMYDLGESEGSMWMALEHLEGRSCGLLIRQQGPMPEGLCRWVLAQAARALAGAHEAKILHNGISSNRLLIVRNEGLSLKLIGFHHASRTWETDPPDIDRSDVYYASPERLMQDPFDERSDIYSLGIALYEMAVGVAPFTRGDLVYHHLHSTPPALLTYRPELSPELVHIVMRCLEKDPAQRYASCRDIISDLNILEASDAMGERPSLIEEIVVEGFPRLGTARLRPLGEWPHPTLPWSLDDLDAVLSWLFYPEEMLRSEPSPGEVTGQRVRIGFSVRFGSRRYKQLWDMSKQLLELYLIEDDDELELLAVGSFATQAYWARYHALPSRPAPDADDGSRAAWREALGLTVVPA